MFGAVALASGLLISLYRAPENNSQPGSAEQGSAVSLVAQELTDLDGRSRYLREWAGTVLLVNFWATWCAPCREEIPLLQRARDRYRDRGFEVIGVAFDETEPVAGFRDQLDIRYPLLLALVDPFALLGASGNEVGGLPHSVLLDGDGQVLEAHTGVLTEDQLQAWIRAHTIP